MIKQAFAHQADDWRVSAYPDHLGSPIAGTNDAGALSWQEIYTPYGEKTYDPVQTRNLAGFTGHIDDDATGLSYMQARYYDPAIGRFLSIDPVGPMAGGPFYVNRYAYVANDPVNNIDPTGMCSTDADGNQVGVCGTDLVSTVVLEVTEFVSPMTQAADSLAEEMGVKVDFTFDPSATGGVVSGSVETGISATVGASGTTEINAIDTQTGQEIAYLNGPIELTAHEVGGHVNDRLTGERSSMVGDVPGRPDLPRSEVNAIRAENQARRNMGIPVTRQSYDKLPPVRTTPNGVAPPRTWQDYRQ